MTVRRVVAPRRIGAPTPVASDGALTGVRFPQHRPMPARSSFRDEAGPALSAARMQLDARLRDERTSLAPPTATRGDPFQERLREPLRAIPFATTTTDGRVAELLGDRDPARRVGRAHPAAYRRSPAAGSSAVTARSSAAPADRRASGSCSTSRRRPRCGPASWSRCLRHSAEPAARPAGSATRRRS